MPPGESVLVSILIVSYRAYTELASCLESLDRFPTGDIDVIVVDHASAPTATAPLLQRFPSVRLIDVSSNPGFAVGVNRAARAARGKYLLLLNPDCIVDDDVALITSANFTEWAHQRNVEAGVMIRSEQFVRQLRAQFDTLVESKQVRRLPGF